MSATLLPDAHRRIGGYVIASVAGRGRGSIVYVARRGTEPRVALKVSRQAHLRATRGECDFTREHHIAKAVAHLNVVRVHGHGMAGADAFLAQEHAGGGSLDEGLPPVAPDRVFAWALQAASALAQVHALGWVHRDIKPANLLLRANGTLALADFGSAGATGDRPEPGQLVGTPRYAAPEQQQGAPAAPSADIYALGVVLFEQLTGRPPFAGETVTELQAQHLMAPVPALPEALSPWMALIDAMLAKDPSQRLRDGQALHDRLRRDLQALHQNARHGRPAGARNLP